MPSIIAEVGQQGIYAPADAARHVAGLRNIMRDLRMIPGTPDPGPAVRDLFGRPLKRFTAPATGVVLFLVTSLAIGAGDPLLGVGVEPLDAAGKTPR